MTKTAKLFAIIITAGSNDSIKLTLPFIRVVDPAGPIGDSGLPFGVHVAGDEDTWGVQST